MTKYLYNGIEGPALPEWDKEAYPYATLGVSDGSIVGGASGSKVWIFKATNSPPTVKSLFLKPHAVTTGKCIYSDMATDKAICDYYEKYGEHITLNEWGAFKEKEPPPTDEGVIAMGEDWTNTDIYYPNDYSDESLAGTLFLAASDPVPVGGAEWKKHDAYKPNTKWDGQTFYKAIGNKWVKHDAYNPQGGTS